MAINADMSVGELIAEINQKERRIAELRKQEKEIDRLIELKRKLGAFDPEYRETWDQRTSIGG